MNSKSNVESDVIPGDFDFRIRPPGDPLDRFVSAVWYARGRVPHGRERILPSPGAVLLVVLGAPLRMTEPGEDAGLVEVSGAWLTGPHERPIFNQPTGETHAVGAVFQPGGIGAFIDGPIDAIANRILSMDELAPSIVAPGTLSAEMDPDATLDALTDALVGAMAPPADHRRWSGAIEQLISADGGSVAAVQQAIGVSRRHFAAQIQQRVGLRPKSIQRIARLQRLLEELDARKPVRWSEEAVGAGYFDQPHAIRDFRMFTGMTPTEYVNRRREAWGHDVEPGEATNFIPEIIR